MKYNKPCKKSKFCKPHTGLNCKHTCDLYPKQNTETNLQRMAETTMSELEVWLKRLGSGSCSDT